MSIDVTLDVFSGRINPSWKLSDRQRDEFIQRLVQANFAPTATPPNRLGYRGFSVSFAGDSSSGAAQFFRGTDGAGAALAMVGVPDIERWLFSLIPAGLISESVRAHVADALSRPPDADPRPALVETERNCPTCHAPAAPLYQPEAWNVLPTRKENNCYNYANNQPTGSFAQPGRAHGVSELQMEAAAVLQAAQKDGLRECEAFGAAPANGKAFYVALVVWPGVDFHWYRQDQRGCWSHKPGRTPATDRDNSGKTIADPRNCDMGFYEFVTFMTTDTEVVIR